MKWVMPHKFLLSDGLLFGSLIALALALCWDKLNRQFPASSPAAKKNDQHQSPTLRKGNPGALTRRPPGLKRRSSLRPIAAREEVRGDQGLTFVRLDLAAFRLAMPEVELGLPILYGSMASAPAKDEDHPDILEPLAEPRLGWRTGGKKVPHPTKVASEGLKYVLRGRWGPAQKRAQWLLDNALAKGDALVFPFTFDLAPKWPYDLKAPWVSGLTQGLALGLFTYLHKATGNDKYRQAAKRVLASYLIPIEKGGFTRFEAQGPYFEEYPTTVPTRVLNGALIAMLALHDYAHIYNDRKAMKLFHDSVARHEDLLPKYDLEDDRTGVPISAYSLSPMRPEVLGRFVKGKATIHRLKLVEHGTNGSTVQGEVDVGSERDDARTSDFYVWPDARYMNWGGRTKTPEGTGRRVNAVQGQYDHSPFQFRLHSIGKDTRLSIDITYADASGPVQVQLHDGKSYHAVGELIPAKERRTESLVVPARFLTSFLAQVKYGRPVDVKYLDDNQLLVAIVGRLLNALQNQSPPPSTGSGKLDSKKLNTFEKYACRWAGSSLLVPARWTNQQPGLPLKGRSKQPIAAAGQEAIAVGWPSVARTGKQLRMVYAAKCQDGRWRLMKAGSNQWQCEPLVVSGERLTPKHRNHCFPFLVELNGQYLLYFSSGSVSGRWNHIMWATSPNGEQWCIGGVAAHEGGIDPVVIPTGAGFEMYYILTGNGRSAIRYAMSPDGRTWSMPRTVGVVDRRLREFHSLAALKHGGSDFLVVDSTVTSGRREWSLLKVEQGKAKSLLRPLYVMRDWEDRGDAIGFGMHVAPAVDGLEVFYAARRPNPKASTRLWRARLAKSKLAQALNDDGWINPDPSCLESLPSHPAHATDDQHPQLVDRIVLTPAASAVPVGMPVEFHVRPRKGIPLEHLEFRLWDLRPKNEVVSDWQSWPLPPYVASSPKTTGLQVDIRRKKSPEAIDRRWLGQFFFHNKKQTGKANLLRNLCADDFDLISEPAARLDMACELWLAVHLLAWESRGLPPPEQVKRLQQLSVVKRVESLPDGWVNVHSIDSEVSRINLYTRQFTEEDSPVVATVDLEHYPSYRKLFNRMKDASVPAQAVAAMTQAVLQGYHYGQRPDWLLTHPANVQSHCGSSAFHLGKMLRDCGFTPEFVGIQSPKNGAHLLVQAAAGRQSLLLDPSAGYVYMIDAHNLGVESIPAPILLDSMYDLSHLDLRRLYGPTAKVTIYGEYQENVIHLRPNR